MTHVIITGGIGSGKSVVSRMLTVMGYPVYDCDSQAITLIDHDLQLRADIVALLGSEAYDAQGHYNRHWVATRVFGNRTMLEQINALVHPAVIRDINRWTQGLDCSMCFVETALMRQSGLNLMADAIWRVTAPDDVRILRVVRRSGLTASQVAQRIEAQRSKEAPFDGETVLVNDNSRTLLTQVLEALAKLNNFNTKNL